jgi:Tfp pilus assembly protein FimT
MKLFKSKLNTRGFGHIEMVVIVFVVAVIAGVGFFVYQGHNKTKSTTAHAGGLNYGLVGTSNGVTFKACKQLVNSAYGGIWNIQVIAGGSNLNSSTVAYMNDYSNSNATGWQWAASSSSWWAGTVTSFSHYANPYVNNYLNFGVGKSNYTSLVRANNLNNC